MAVDDMKTLFVRVHARVSCDADDFTKGRLVGIRRNTTLEYLMRMWEKYGGWE